jgi:hypothetical protein
METMRRPLHYAVVAPHGSRIRQVVTTLALVAGAGLIASSAWVHYYLWSHYHYKSIPQLGVAFIWQAVVGFVLAVALVLSRRLVAVALGAGYCAASAGALLLSVWFGFLGIQETFATAYTGFAFAVEVTGFVVLVAAGVAMLRR